ncbi:MAG: chemotaxis protein CheC [Solirubrobacteraceae bacterium]|nr:chemotaxis protein CheC [Solirubrobacteraceae bacterium]MEA2242470.1 chemotaxis protein CheC [Solirubrobacteraceae bacterium]
MRTHYTEVELDALRELANVGGGTAATSLSDLLGMPIDVAVPSAYALPLADAIGAAGPPDLRVTGVAVALLGDLDGAAIMLFPDQDARTLCALLGLETDTELSASALGEVVNILCAAYLGALGSMTGLRLELGPPHTVVDRLGALMDSILTVSAGPGEVALMLDSALVIEGRECSLAFLLVATGDGLDGLLAQLGVGG